MRINIGQTTNLFHVDALNRSVPRNTQEKGESNLLPRKDIAAISPAGKASSAIQKLVNQLELGQEGRDYFQDQIQNGTRGVLSNEKTELKKLRQDDEYNHILENSDDGFHRPTMDSQLHDAYMGYLNEAFEKGRDSSENAYEYIVNIVNIRVDSLTKAYQDVYKDIVAGYESGTREVWTQDFEEGADYIEFEMEGKNYRFHKLTMEEELDRLNKAYEKAAKDVEDKANLMIDMQKLIEEVMPKYEAEMRSIGAQIARWEMSEGGDGREIAAERIKDRLSAAENNFQKMSIYEMLMEARKNWFNTEDFLDLKTGSI